MDIRSLVSIVIEESVKREIEHLLQVDFGDAITYYEQTIIDALIDLYGIDKDKALDLIECEIAPNQDKYLEYVAAGFPAARKGYIAIHSIGEIEIQPCDMPFNVTPNREPVIERYTDLQFVNGVGVVYMGYDHIALNLNNLEID